MKLHEAITEALKSDGWIIHESLWFAAGYMTIHNKVRRLSRTPIDNDILRCISINQFTGELNGMLTPDDNDYHDIAFCANAILNGNYEVVSDPSIKKKMVREFISQKHRPRTR